MLPGVLLRSVQPVAFLRRSSSPEPDTTAWPDLADAIGQAEPTVRILPVDAEAGRRVLGRLGVTEQSTLGALAARTGGLVLDHGWMRILGGGSRELPDIATASSLGDGVPPHLIVGFDVLGGRFAIDGGGLGVKAGEVCYWGPDTLRWTGIGSGHTAFVLGALSGDLAEFYADLRWAGWEAETANIGLDQGISIFPPPFTAEGRDIGAASRRAISYRELLDYYADRAGQLDGIDNGAQVRFGVTDGPAQP